MADTLESPILKLPPELRNAIYRFVLIDPNAVLVTKDWRAPALLCTGKQICGEALKMYFAENIFRIDMGALFPGPMRYYGYMSALARWYRIISTPGRNALEKVYIDDMFYHTQDEAKEALVYYTTGSAEAGCGVANGVLFVEARIFDIEVSEDKSFWTNDPEIDFARVEQPDNQRMEQS